MTDLKGKVAVITGGGTGTGKAIAQILADSGVNIVVNYSKSKTDALKTVKELIQTGVQAIAVQADVSQKDEVINLFKIAFETYGRIDMLVNNAGYTSFVAYDDLESMSDEIWEKTLAVNLKGNFYCTREAVKYMKMNSDSRGSIINIAGTAGLTGLGSSVVYCASKAGIISLTKSFAIALAPNIQVNTISPGIIEDTRWCAGQDEFNNIGRQATPMKRLATAMDIAEAAKYIFSSSHFINGQNLIIDGGRVVH
ncbi:MAG: SDR family oxidoreductase [Bacteroidetes bacterium]|nr:SDR family oxidoreductase [Bacteroidota bacterium]